MSEFDKNRFVFHETFTNTTTGKSSGSGFIGVLLGIIAGISFIATMVGYFLQIPNTIDVMQQIIALIAIAGALLGVRKFYPMYSKNRDSQKTVDDKHFDKG